MSRIRNQVAIAGVGYSDLAPHAPRRQEPGRARQLKKADVTLVNSGSPLGTGAVVLSNEAI